MKLLRAGRVAASSPGAAARPSDITGPRMRSGAHSASVLATALAVLAAVEAVLDIVLAIGNHRSLRYLVNEHEILGMLVAVLFAAVGAIVVRQRPRHALGWLFVLEGQLQGLGVLGEYADRRPAPPLHGLADAIAQYTWLPGMVIAAGLFTLLFPDGRPASRRWRPVVVVATLAVAVAAVAFVPVSDATHPPSIPAHLVIGAVVVALACGVAGAVGLLVRAIRTTGAERRRIGWFFTAFAIVAVAQVLPVSPAVPTIATAFVPVALGIAMTRHRLFDGDRLLNRTLVYSALTVLVAAVLGLTVGLASASVGGDGTGAVVAAVVIALGIAPARAAVQRGVDRLLYGGRRDPYAALAGLGRDLSVALTPDEVLPVVVSTVAAALHVPYAAVTLRGDPRPAAASGEPTDQPLELPLSHAGTPVGTLIVGLPTGQRFLDPGDERLLRDFAEHAGAVTAAVALTHDLRRSRDDLAVARDEERHRIRRDLHDGLGPTLAGVALGLGAARRSVSAIAPETASLLGHLETELRDGLDEVKRLVADLRPTTLEQLGLIEALRQYADTVTTRSQGALKVSVDAPVSVPGLDSDVEIAAYRIVLEAVTNTTRHAMATRCSIGVTRADDALHLSVHDNGAGVKATVARPGIGLRSMVERATELGGSCTIAAGSAGGTVVSAVLPVQRSGD
jgi:signal transduction histidine kinase